MAVQPSRFILQTPGAAARDGMCRPCSYSPAPAPAGLAEVPLVCLEPAGSAGRAGCCICANKAVEMQRASFTNLDLLERNFFLLQRDLNRGLDAAWVCNMGVFFPMKSPCALPRPFGGGTRSRSPCNCWGRFSASCASVIPPPLGVVLGIPDGSHP